MFGVVPKSIWQKTNPPDENNLCTWAMRCLLIEDGTQLILIDNGIAPVDVQMLRLVDMAADDTITASIKRVTNNQFTKARYVSTK